MGAESVEYFRFDPSTLEDDIVAQTFQPALAGTCDAFCEGLAQTAVTFERSQFADPNRTFYKVPSNFSRHLAPGTVLAVEHATDLSKYLVPSSLSMSRIIYTSTDLNGTIQPTSAYILWPYMKPTSSGFSAVAWAHGTSGTFAPCAPSNYHTLQYQFMMPFALAMQGIAVIAPDYVGLGIGSLPDGTPIPHQYTASPAQANDLANAVIAARSAFPKYLAANGPFVVAGHSQGGGVSWAYAERQAQHPIPGYKGTLSFAPALRSITWLKTALAELAAGALSPSNQVLVTIQNKLIEGVTAVYPAYNYSAMTPASYDVWKNGVEKVQGCLATDTLVQSALLQTGNLTIDELARLDWPEDPTVQEFTKRTDIGGKRFAGPLLVLAGEIDSTIPLALIEDVVDETCKLIEKSHGNEELEFMTFGQMNHFPLIQASQHVWMDWIKDRLSSGSKKGKRHAKPKCKKTVVPGFQTNSTVQSIPPNWLLAAAEPGKEWEYAF
ncbi:Alpha/Beta hydrolase protein [Trichoderma velutinum]